MPRLYNAGQGVGDQLHVPTVKRRDFDGVVKEFVQVPIRWTGGALEFIEHKPGNVYICEPELRFRVVKKGDSIDVPDFLVKALRSQCPHLITQEEFEAQSPPAPEPVKLEESKSEKKK